jgi:hypothetical protein
MTEAVLWAIWAASMGASIVLQKRWRHVLAAIAFVAAALAVWLSGEHWLVLVFACLAVILLPWQIRFHRERS